MILVECYCSKQDFDSIDVVDIKGGKEHDNSLDCNNNGKDSRFGFIFIESY